MLLRSFVRSPLAAAGLRRAGAQAGQKRNMGGLVKKNYYVEEWNGRREITEKTFKFDTKTTPPIVFMALIFPAFIYFVMRDELANKYKKLKTPHEMM